MPTPAIPGNFTVGGWLAEPALCRLSSRGRTLRVRPKVMDVLAYLAAHQREVVSKDALLQDVWGTDAISESALTRTIAELRQALGDSAAEPAVLETIQKRGYRLIAPVCRVPTPAPFARTTSTLRDPQCWLVHEGRETLLGMGEHLLGRDLDVSVRLDAIAASRRHAKLTVTEVGATLEDLGSKNGTFVRGARVNGRVPLDDGDEIGIGGMRVVFRCARGPAATRTADPP